MRLQSQTCLLYAEQAIYLSDPGSQDSGVLDFSEVERTRIAFTPQYVTLSVGLGGDTEDVTLAVVIEIHDGPPPIHSGDWDHIVEASIHLESGQLCVADIESHQDLSVASGWYRVRSYHAPITGEADAVAHRLEFWPSAPAAVEVIGAGAA